MKSNYGLKQTVAVFPLLTPDAHVIKSLPLIK